MYVHTRVQYILVWLYLFINLPIYMYVYIREIFILA